MPPQIKLIRGDVPALGVDHNGPILMGVLWWLWSFSGLFLGVRIYTKRSKRHALWWDDWILIISWVMLLVTCILTQVVRNTRSTVNSYNSDPQVLSTTGLIMTIIAMISLIAAALSKVSFGITLLRLTSGWYRRLVWFTIFGLVAGTLPPVLFLWVQCTPVESAWTPTVTGRCWDQLLVLGLDTAGAVWCSLMDFILALLPWRIIWGTTLAKKEKIGVGLAMSVGILAGICGIMKSVYIVQLYQKQFFDDNIDVAIWTATEIAAAIIGASIPILRVLFVKEMTSKAHYRVHSEEGISLSRQQQVSWPRLSRHENPSARSSDKTKSLGSL